MDQLSNFSVNSYSLLGYALIFLGLVGAVVPVLPGPPLIWLGALAWAWGDHFTRIQWPTLVGLGILALVAWGADIFLTTVLSRRAGASWRSLGGAILGGIAGGAFLSQIPILGTLAGALIGSVIGMWLVEYLIKQNGRTATAAVYAFMAGSLLNMVLEIIVSLVMTLIFVWQAFL